MKFTIILFFLFCLTSFKIEPSNVIQNLNRIQMKSIRRNNSITNSEVFAIADYFKNRRKEIFNKFLIDTIYPDTFFICEFIKRPNLNEIQGFIWDNNYNVFEFKIYNDTLNFQKSNKTRLINVNDYLLYFLDSNFKSLRYKISQSHKILDGCIILLAKMIRIGNKYYIEHIEFKDFVY